MNKMSKNTRSLLTFIVVLLLGSSLLSLISVDDAKDKTTLDQVAAKVKAGEVKSLEVAGNTVTIELTDGKKQLATKEPNDSLPTILGSYGVTAEQLSKVTYNPTEPSAYTAFLFNSLPLILIIGFSILSLWYVVKQAQGANNKAMSFGQSGAKEYEEAKGKRIVFADVAGNQEAKIELEEVVDFLREPKKFLDLGARIPRGVLLIGPPGTGKTLLARAVAGEAKVPFFHISGSEFVEMFVGVGASRVRDLFRKAKKQAPAIIFVDEIDAVGRQRGTGVGGSHDEREQTLNQILVEMDGFEKENNVIVMGATNRPDVLDPALLRPGRFDRQVTLDLPDINDREAILKVHAVGKKLAEDVKLRAVAERTVGFSGADLANVLNEAALLAGRMKAKEISQIMCLDSIEKVILGPERKSHVMNAEEKKVIAYHEAGHALVAHFHPHSSDPVQKVSIISRGRAGGYTLKAPTEDRHLKKRSEFLGELAVLLAGYTTEKIIFGEVTTGPSNDLKKATALAKAFVTQYGMSEELGARTYGEHEDMIFLGRQISENQDYGENTAGKIDIAINGLIAGAQKDVEDILVKHRTALDLVAKTLLEKETIEREEFKTLVEGK